MKFRVLFLILLFSAACSGAPERPQGQKKGASLINDLRYLENYLSWYIPSKMVDKNITAVSVAVVHKDFMVFSSGYGEANRDRKLPADENTMYKIGGISRFFTSLLAHRLAAEGHINLYSTTTRYLPDLRFYNFAGKQKQVTLFQLLNDTSGIVSQIQKSAFSLDSPPFDQVVNHLQQLPLLYDPGTTYLKSDAGYTLLGLILEKAMNEKFADLMQKYVIDELKLTETQYRPEDKNRRKVAAAYYDGKEVEITELRDLPSMGLYSSVTDLAELSMMILNRDNSQFNHVLPASVIDKALTVSSLPFYSDRTTVPGTGFYRIKEDGDTLYRFEGETPESSSLVYILPDTETALVFLTSKAEAIEFLEDIASKSFEVAFIEDQIMNSVIDEESEERKIIQTNADVIEQVEGEYTSESGLVKVYADQKQLYLRMLQKDLWMRPHPGGDFSLRYMFLNMLPVTIGELTRNEVGFHKYNDNLYLFIKRQAFERPAGVMLNDPLELNSWGARSGQYNILNPGDDLIIYKKIELLIENKRLLLSILEKGSFQKIYYPLNIIDENLAAHKAIAEGHGFILKHLEEENEPVIHFSGYLLGKR